MRKIDLIIIHCSATKEGSDYTFADIDYIHRRNGWAGPLTGISCGYHFIIGLDGRIELGRPVEETGAHTSGFNANSVGICYIGGLDSAGNPKDTRTNAQKKSLLRLIKGLKRQFPKATVHGHNEFANKACPCFNAQKEYEQI